MLWRVAAGCDLAADLLSRLNRCVDLVGRQVGQLAQQFTSIAQEAGDRLDRCRLDLGGRQANRVGGPLYTQTLLLTGTRVQLGIQDAEGFSHRSSSMASRDASMTAFMAGRQSSVR